MTFMAPLSVGRNIVFDSGPSTQQSLKGVKLLA